MCVQSYTCINVEQAVDETQMPVWKSSLADEELQLISAFQRGNSTGQKTGRIRGAGRPVLRYTCACVSKAAPAPRICTGESKKHVWKLKVTFQREVGAEFMLVSQSCNF